MTLKERVENSPVVYLLGALLTGFLGGLGTYEAILRIARLDTVRQGAYVFREEVERDYVRRSDVKELSRGVVDAPLKPAATPASGGNAVTQVEGGSPDSPKPSPSPFPRMVETEEYLFELKTCALNGEEVKCDFLVTAKNRDITLTFWGTSRLIENNGNEMFASQIWLGNDYSKGGDGGVIQKEFTRSAPLKMSVAFIVDPTVSKESVKLIELVCSGFKVPFMNVGLR
jgi:hypothetical protein